MARTTTSLGEGEPTMHMNPLKCWILGLATLAALACQSTGGSGHTDTAAAEPDASATATATPSGANGGALRTHQGVCGCKPTEICVSASSIGDMHCAPGLSCEPFDCTCFTERGFENPCPKDFACQSTNWPIVTCVRAQGSEP